MRKINVSDIFSGEIVELPRRKMRVIAGDPVKSAEHIQLVYVNDSQAGIRRIRNGKGFTYELNKKKVINREVLERIKKLVIPPAWEQVWICKLPEGHLQVTGIDARNRKQYKYHSLWSSFRNQTKFYRLLEFGNSLPQIRLQIEKDLALPGMPVEKVLAAMVSLMQRTTIRVGNSSYEKLNGSFGLTTLKDQHVAVNGSSIRFSFKGKKGIHHSISIKSKRLAAIVKKCREIPGKELFQYYDEKGDPHSIDSGMVNEYIRKISGGDYTSKDLRTWSGSVKALLAFREIGPPESATEAKKKIVTAMDMVSKHLGNTRNICRKYYVHPVIILLYEQEDLQKYFNKIDQIEEDDGNAGLTPGEKTLMKILASESLTKK